MGIAMLRLILKKCRIRALPQQTKPDQFQIEVVLIKSCRMAGKTLDWVIEIQISWQYVTIWECVHFQKTHSTQKHTKCRIKQKMFGVFGKSV